MKDLMRIKRIGRNLARMRRAQEWVFVNGKGFREGVEWLD